MESAFQSWGRTARNYQRSAIVRLILLAVMFTVFVLLMLQSTSTNQVESTPVNRQFVIKVTLDSLSQKLGIDYDSGLDYEQRITRQNATLVTDIRWPRVLMAALVGAALGLAGAVIQGVFRNPLADPGLIGVSSGAAVGAVTAILLGLNISGLLKILPDFLIDPGQLSGQKFAQALLAFAVGLLATLAVYRLSRFGARTDTINLLIVGLAFNSIAGAYVGLATYVGGDRLASDIVFWMLGSVANVNWQDVYIVIPFVAVGLIILPRFARQFNVMSLGEAEAQHLGVNTLVVRRISLAVSALMVGVSVGFAGIIGFIGLVTPHVMRFIFGPDHRIILPASALGGAIFLVTADMFGRTLPNPATPGITVEVPVGILTALVGGPFFLFLVLLGQMRKKS